MAFTPIPIGSLGWGAPVNAALTSQDARVTDLEETGVTATELGFLSVPFAPEALLGTTALVAGTVTMVRLRFGAPATVTGIVVPVNVAGSGLTASQNFGGLYNAAGTRLALTADQSTVWNTANANRVPFTAPYNLTTPGYYYAAVVTNGTTPPVLLRGVSQTIAQTLINGNIPVATARYTYGPTAQTSLPASVTMGSRTLSTVAWWIGLY